jgi:hypothetical protein
MKLMGISAPVLQLLNKFPARDELKDFLYTYGVVKVSLIFKECLRLDIIG